MSRASACPAGEGKAIAHRFPLKDFRSAVVGVATIRKSNSAPEPAQPNIAPVDRCGNPSCIDAFEGGFDPRMPGFQLTERVLEEAGHEVEGPIMETITVEFCERLAHAKIAGSRTGAFAARGR